MGLFLQYNVPVPPSPGVFGRFMNALLSYFNASLEELRHVRWPTRQQAVRLSLIVIGFTVGSSALFGVLDFLLSRVVSVLLSVTS